MLAGGRMCDSAIMHCQVSSVDIFADKRSGYGIEIKDYELELLVLGLPSWGSRSNTDTSSGSTAG